MIPAKSRFALLLLGTPLAFASAALAEGDAAGPASLPADAKPGQCYAHVAVPAEYRDEIQNIVKREASTRIEVQPAKYEWAEEKVLVKEASKRLEVVPATYETVQEQIVVKPASNRLEPVPAEYEWTEEKVLVKAAQTVWKKGRGPVEKVDHSTGEIMCLVEEPAVYKTVRKHVLKTAASTRQVEIPAVTKTIAKRVLKTPATTQEVEIPAEYAMVRVQKLVEPAKELKTEIPAVNESLTTRKLVRPASVAWQEVLCGTNINPPTIQALQKALKSAGHDPGDFDGVIGQQTLVAVTAYQQEKGLPTGGLTLATLASLGVTPK